VGCNLKLHVKDNEIIKVTSDRKSPVNKGKLCVKGRFGFDYVHHPDRLKYPMIRENGKLKRASWTKALDLVATKLSEIKEKDGPDSIAFLASAKCTNEENYLLQKFARGVIGTNNIDHCARL
jgi:predicted molibdopterin-dependent oxidoreductase YjgC